VLGGDQSAYPNAAGDPGAPWFPALEGLLRKAVRHHVPTLGVCLGGQLLARRTAAWSSAAPRGRRSGPAWSAGATRPTATRCSSTCRCCPTWSSGTATRSPSCPSARSCWPPRRRYPHQAFRLGDRAWGLQFHIECDADMIAGGRRTDGAGLDELGYDAEAVVAATAEILADVEEVWQPFAARFAALALGTLPNADIPNPGTIRTLPLLGQ
jgi:GMP synthase-like glutamine amidotransferase